MKRTTLLLFVPMLVLAGGVASGGLFFETGPDETIFPKQEIPVYFDHAYHVRKPDEATGVTGEGLSCTFCHENVSQSKASSDRDIPGHGSCDLCHDEWIGEEDEPAPVSGCANCHKDLDPTGTSTQAAPLSIPTPNVIFPHEAHVKQEIACTECHKNVSGKTVATRDDFPTMDRCIACHEEKKVSTACGTCHLTGRDGRVRMYYPDGVLKPSRYHAFAIHDADFLEDHAVPAQRDKAYCEQCHSTSDCLACHDGIARDVRYHPGDWIAVHPIHAKKDDLRCQSCHRLQTFCFNCHLASGVASVSPTNAPFQIERQTIRRDPQGEMPTGPHPMGPTWTGLDGSRGRNFHGFHAQRNIRSCVSCHQEQYCLRCHTSAARAGPPTDQRTLFFSPHGPNPERLKGSAASKHVARACLKCHAPNDPSWRE